MRSDKTDCPNRRTKMAAVRQCLQRWPNRYFPRRKMPASWIKNWSCSSTICTRKPLKSASKKTLWYRRNRRLRGRSTDKWCSSSGRNPLWQRPLKRPKSRSEERKARLRRPCGPPSTVCRFWMTMRAPPPSTKTFKHLASSRNSRPNAAPWSTN